MIYSKGSQSLKQLGCITNAQSTSRNGTGVLHRSRNVSKELFPCAYTEATRVKTGYSRKMLRSRGYRSNQSNQANEKPYSNFSARPGRNTVEATTDNMQVPLDAF